MKTNSTLPSNHIPNFRGLGGIKNRIALCLALAFSGQSIGQGVTGIVTDFNGYWKSGVSAINPVKPDNSHNLLAFTYNGTMYSTGVNDCLLNQHNHTFVPGSYSALPVSQLTGSITGNTKIGLGASYDNVAYGPGNPVPANDPAKYLTDGANGLDLGTCVANLPAGQLFFAVNNLNLGTVGDGIPDLVITQIADPSGSSLDSYEFTDINGNRVGNTVTIALQNLPVVGNWTADFYEASAHPMTLSGGFTHTDRPIRLWTADFSSFGITAQNVSQVAYFRIRLNGNSDVAFVAYNNDALSFMTSLLPIKLSQFTGKQKENGNLLQWTTENEINSDRFVLERSSNGSDFTPLATLATKGNSLSKQQYEYTDQHPAGGRNAYRLKMIDAGGKETYSSIVEITNNDTKNVTLRAYPNPASSRIQVDHGIASGNEMIRVYNMSGVLLLQQKSTPGSSSETVNLQSLPRGQFIVEWNSGNNRQTIVVAKI